MTEHNRKLIVVEVQGEELCIRILEAMTEKDRPEGVSARDAFRGLSQKAQDQLRRACDAAMEYFAECLGDAKEPS